MNRRITLIAPFLAVLLLTAPRCIPAPKSIPGKEHEALASIETAVEPDAVGGTLPMLPAIPAQIALLVSNINSIRGGLPPVTTNASASSAASAYASVMAAQGKAAHGLDGRTSRERLATVGINPPDYGLNQLVQKADDALTMTMVLNTPGYLSVTRTAKWTQVGVGFAIGGGKGYWCIIFFM